MEQDAAAEIAALLWAAGAAAQPPAAAAAGIHPSVSGYIAPRAIRATAAKCARRLRPPGSRTLAGAAGA